MKHFQFKNFDYSKWNIPEHDVIRDEKTRKNLFEQGFEIIPDFLSTEEIEELSNLYTENHSANPKDGGIFVSIYSKNLEYRQKMHHLLSDLLKEKLDSIFHEYKLTCLNFITKFPGKNSELFVHQDQAQIDEFEHSQVGLWIPLQDVNVQNGTMGVIPYSHFTIPPHRTLYHRLPLSEIYPTVIEYMQPLEMKAGSLLLFDIRLFHNSFVNSSNIPRIVIASSIVPRKAAFNFCYRGNENEDNYEMMELNDDFYLTFKDFRSEKINKPEGTITKKVKIEENFVEKDEFLEFCIQFKILPTEIGSQINEFPTNAVLEPLEKAEIPTEKNRFLNYLQKIKIKFKL